MSRRSPNVTTTWCDQARRRTESFRLLRAALPGIQRSTRVRSFRGLHNPNFLWAPIQLLELRARAGPAAIRRARAQVGRRAEVQVVDPRDFGAACSRRSSSGADEIRL